MHAVVCVRPQPTLRTCRSCTQACLHTYTSCVHTNTYTHTHTHTHTHLRTNRYSHTYMIVNNSESTSSYKPGWPYQAPHQICFPLWPSPPHANPSPWLETEAAGPSILPPAHKGNAFMEKSFIIKLYFCGTSYVSSFYTQHVLYVYQRWKCNIEG